MDKVAEFYEQYPYPSVEHLGKKALEEYANRVLVCASLTTKQLKGKTVLDAGCGTGEITCSFATHAQRAMGADISRASLEKARALAKENNLTNVEFVQRDILRVYPHEKWDMVTSFGALHHTTHPQKGFEILARSVRRNGILVIGFYHPWGGIWQRMEKACVGALARSPEEKISFLEKLFGKTFRAQKKTYWLDRIANPREKYSRVSTMERAFEHEGFELIGIQAGNPKLLLPFPFSLFEKWTFELSLLLHRQRFVIMAGKRTRERKN